MGLLDWLTDIGGPSSPMGGEAGDMSAMRMPPPASPPMPPVQMTGTDTRPWAAGSDPMTAGGVPMPADPMTAGGEPSNGPGLPFANGTDPMTAGGAPPNGPGLPMPQGTDPMTAGGAPPNGPGLPPAPMPQPRPPGAGAPPPAQPPAAPPGPPMQVAPQNVPPTAPVAPSPGQGFLSRALGIDAQQGRQLGQGLGAGLKSVGDNWNKPGLAAFSGSAGSTIEGMGKEQQVQQKQATDYLNAAIKAKQQGDEAGYKQNYLQYLAASLKQKTDAAASKDASNKNDTPTQLYLSAQRLVQPDRNALNKQLDQMRKDGADPAAIAKVQSDGEAAIQAKLQGHYGTLGIHPQDAATLAKQPGNTQDNPVDAGKLGITKDNIAKKLQPGQFFTNPSDGKVYQYKGPKAVGGEKKGGTPDKPTNPEPIDPMKPAKSPVSAMAQAGADDED